MATISWPSSASRWWRGPGDVLRRPRVQRALDAVLGAVLVALGVRLAGERR